MQTLTTCTACGCTCDDIRLSVDKSGTVVEAVHACGLGVSWFEKPSLAGPAALIDGKPATLDAAIVAAAKLLREAKLPLVTGLQSATNEANRAAVALADQLGACIDWTSKPSDAASTLALQTAGGVTATLGEVAQRSDLVIVWGVDLATTHPRHFERYSLEPTSPWIKGRKDRKLIVIADQKSETSKLADATILLTAGSDFEALTTLRMLLAGMAPDAANIEQQTGVTLTEWQSLVDTMKSAKYGAVIYGGNLAASREATVALTQLMADLTAHTRWVAVPAGSAGNKSGASNVLTWQTGYPLGVSFAAGYPQYGPDEWTTDKLLSRGETDAVLVVGGELDMPSTVPTIALDWQDTQAMQSAKIAIPTARPGVECGGTTQRVDGITLPMRAARATDRPTMEEVLKRIGHCLK
ncbi:formylmethanofuran dehydrogenase subunit B [Aeoliella sp. SH292]|uniref:formylmethanofuran dehydrogenase subunit B n=1 Tax=Aeoliella sp. SH292 TaxID=3454464 RepID=UPI003F94CD52